MEGRRVILGLSDNPTILEGSEAGYAGGVLWLYLRDMTLAQAFALLSDPASTSEIAFEYGEMADRYEGFTHLILVQEDENEVRAALERRQDNG